MTATMRHDDQADEEHYDSRIEADDDTEKGKIHFPADKLFGREKEMKTLHDFFSPPTEQGFSTPGELGSSNGAVGPITRILLVKGFSGCGKSALVQGFIQSLRQRSAPHIFAKGKYNEHVSVEPFSAINEAMGRVASTLTVNVEGEEILKQVRAEVWRSRGGFTNADAKNLLKILPALCTIITPEARSRKKSPVRLAPHTDIKAMSYLFADFMSLLCRGLGRPLILFLDDLQWADEASIELLEPILSDISIDNLVFIGGYRSNNIEPDHLFRKLIEKLESSSDRRTLTMEVSNLSLEDVTAFVAETLQLGEDEVGQLSEAIFSRTLGNIFFCRQALEKLVRQNAIYFDVMTFRWEFNLSGTDLNAILSDSVVEMIQAKLRSQCSRIQTVLVVAAYIRNIIDIPILLECLHMYDCILSRAELEGALNHAAVEGLLLRSRSNSFKFSHDKVQEAAYTSIKRSERQRLKAIIASVLFQITDRNERDPRSDEWIIFVAAEYFRSIPKSMVTEESLQLAKLFLRVAEVSSSKGSFEKALRYLHCGVEFLRLNENMWVDHYDLCITMFNHLIFVEFARGDMDGTKAAMDEIMWNGKSLKDTCIAYHTKVEWTVKTNSRNYELGAMESIKLLENYGQRIPMNPSKVEIAIEHARMTLALRGRRISALADLPIAEDDSMMKLLFQLCHLLSLARNHSLNTFVTMRAIRISLEHGLTKYMSEILMTYTIPLRIAGKFSQSYSYATVVSRIYERFPEDRGAEYALAQMILYNGVLPLKNRFAESIDALFSSYRLGLTYGDVDTALVAAMLLCMHYHASSLPLNSMIESKLLAFEEKSKLYHQSNITAIFQCCRQFQHNLVHPSECPTQLKGIIMDEDKILAELDGNSKFMTVRDFSVFRMMLAVIFDDEETMEEMMVRLEPYPYFDLPVARLHLRLLFHGISSLVLGRRRKKHEYTRKGMRMLEEFKKLDKIGSENAQPVCKCFRALRQNKKSLYDDAIAMCSSTKVTYLEALMNEHCGLMLLEKGGKDGLAEGYLGKALWLYHDWGAFAKVEAMKKRFHSLAAVPRKNKTECTAMTIILQHANNFPSMSESTATNGAAVDDPFQLRSRKW